MNFSWLDLFRTLTLEATLAIGCAFAIAALAHSGFWRRLIWQACVLALGVLVACESTGAARALTAWLAAPREDRSSEAAQQSKGITSPFTQMPSESILENEEPTLAAVSPATSVRQTWWPGIIWLTGFVLIGTRLGFAMLLFGRFRKQRRLARNPQLLQLLQEVAHRLRVRRTVRASESETLLTPVAFGILRPCVCVPADFTLRFNPVQQSAMLAHELAHVAGHDPVWYWLADVVTALLWWHPIVWFARRQFHASSEAAADEASLAVENGPDVLAECLVQLGARLQRPLGFALLGVSGFRSDLGRRVERLIQLPRRPWRPINRAVGVAIKLGALFALTCIALVCLAWIDPPEPGTTVKSAWATSLARAALVTAKEAIEDFKLSDVLPDPLALPAAKARNTLRKPVFLANAQAASVHDAQATSPVSPGRDRKEIQEKADSIGDAAVSFGPAEIEPLFNRTFKVDPETFIPGVISALGYSANLLSRPSIREVTPSKNLYGSPLPGPVIDGPAAPADALGRLANRPGFSGGTSSSNIQINRPKSPSEVIEAFFAAAGVNFPKSEPGTPESPGVLGFRKKLFFNDRSGMIFVRATSVDLEVIEKAIQVVNVLPRTEKLEARVFRFDPAALTESLEKWAKVNPKLLSESYVAVMEHESVSDRFRRYLVAAGVEFPNSPTRTEASASPFSDLHVWPDETDSNGTNPTQRKSLFFKDRMGLIYVRGTLEDIDKIDKAIRALHATPRKVQFQVQVFQVSVVDSKALGFDWLLAQPTGPGTMNGFSPEVESQLARQSAVPDAANGVAVAPQQTNASVLRSAILNEAQFGVLRRNLEQRTDADILAPPSGRTLSGQPMIIDVSGMKAAPPSDEQASDTTGIQSIELIPFVKGDGTSIELTLIADGKEFMGYDDPGPFLSGTELKTRDLFDPPRPIPSELPVRRFRQRQVLISAVLTNGQTLLLNGVISKQIVALGGKAPRLCDMPMLGRFFRSESSTNSTPRKELFIFVTPKVLDAVGE